MRLRVLWLLLLCLLVFSPSAALPCAELFSGKGAQEGATPKRPKEKTFRASPPSPSSTSTTNKVYILPNQKPGQDSLFWLKPGEARSLAAILLKYTDRYVFEIGEYFLYNHGSVVAQDRLKLWGGLREIIWAGQIRIVNMDRLKPGPGRVLSSVATSGNVYEMVFAKLLFSVGAPYQPSDRNPAPETVDFIKGPDFKSVTVRDFDIRTLNWILSLYGLQHQGANHFPWTPELPHLLRETPPGGRHAFRNALEEMGRRVEFAILDHPLARTTDHTNNLHHTRMVVKGLIDLPPLRAHRERLESLLQELNELKGYEDLTPGKAQKIGPLLKALNTITSPENLPNEQFIMPFSGGLRY